jgi:hypothetical protein
MGPRSARLRPCPRLPLNKCGRNKTLRSTRTIQYAFRRSTRGMRCVASGRSGREVASIPVIVVPDLLDFPGADLANQRMWTRACL